MNPLHLALQGGGSHGAFTWGVLDALLQDSDAVFPALSGASAGALNAVAFASGWSVAQRSHRDGASGARETLRAVWEEVVGLGAYGAAHRQWIEAWIGTASLLGWPGGPALSFHPLQNLLQRHIDFDALQERRAPAVHIGATHVRSGRARIFSGPALTLEAALASTCLPTLFPTVVIDGEAYWDGGYSVNPPLAPFLAVEGPIDVLLVQINPMCSATPVTIGDVQQRANELAFNAGLLSQLRAVAHVNQLAELGLLPSRRRIRLHRIGGSEDLQRFPQSSRAAADAGVIRELFALGRDAGAGWMAAHAGDVGVRSTIDVHEYADDTWLRFSAADAPAMPWWRRAANRCRAMIGAVRTPRGAAGQRSSSGTGW